MNDDIRTSYELRVKYTRNVHTTFNYDTVAEAEKTAATLANLPTFVSAELVEVTRRSLRTFS